MLSNLFQIHKRLQIQARIEHSRSQQIFVRLKFDNGKVIVVQGARIFVDLGHHNGVVVGEFAENAMVRRSQKDESNGVRRVGHEHRVLINVAVSTEANLRHQITEMGSEEVTAIVQRIAESRYRFSIEFWFRRCVGQNHGQMRSPVTPFFVLDALWVLNVSTY